MRKILLLFLLSAIAPLSMAQLSYESPRLWVEEDFTDTTFNGVGSGTNGNNWGFGGHARWGAVNNRPGIPYAAVRATKAGSGSGWDALVSWFYRINGQKQMILMDKEFDVQVLKFTAFSDAAGNNVSPHYGIEVAMLEDKAGADFGHDLSFEAQQTFLRTGAAEGPLQLDANVENSDHVYITGTRNAHHASGRETAQTMNNTYQSLVIWRNRLGGFPNIEQWGALNSADYDVNQKMESGTNPINPDYLQFNHIQIALFDRINTTSAANTLFREGYDNETAQMGISYMHFGVTKISDFNLDYAVNEADADTLIKYLNTSAGTIRTGDADNNQVVNASDANALIGFWAGDFGNVLASAGYNAANGNVTVSELKNVSFLEIKGPAGSLSGVTPDLSAIANSGFTKTDSSLTLFTKDHWDLSDINLGNIAATGLNATDFKLTVNYRGSNLGRGVTVNFGELIDIVASLENMAGGNQITVDGLNFALPKNTSVVNCLVADVYGHVLYNSALDAGTNTALASVSSGFRIIHLRDAQTGKVVGVRKYFKSAQ